MAGFVLLGMLAAFGLVCAVWILCGLFLKEKSGGVLICPDGDIRLFAQRYLWLREMGLIKRRLLVADVNLDDRDRQWLEAQGIETYSREALANRIGIGAEAN